MRKKPVSALGIMALLFSLMGIAFVISGAATWYFSGETDAQAVGPVHMLLGGVFLIVGVGMFIAVGVRRRKAKRLMENGRYIWGEIAALEEDTKIRINHRYPCYAVVCYKDVSGKRNSFRSFSSLALRNRYDLIGQKVKVYIEDHTYRNYYVDIGSVL